MVSLIIFVVLQFKRNIIFERKTGIFKMIKRFEHYFRSGTLYLIIPVLIILQGNAMANNLDSITLLVSGKTGIEKVKALNELTLRYSADYPAKAMAFGIEALKLSRILKSPNEEAQALFNLAEISFNMNNLQEAIRYYEQSADVLLKNSGIESKSYIDRLGDIGYCYLMLNHYEKALGFFEKGLDLAIKIKYDEQAASMYSNIGTIYVEWGDYGKAITCFQKAMDIDKQDSRSDQISIDLNNIGKIYELTGKFEHAIPYYQEALEIEKKAGNKQRIAIRLNNLGTLYKAWKKYTEALNYFQQALEIERSLGDNEKVGKRLAYIGATYLAMGQYDKCYTYLTQAMAILSKTELTDELARLQNSFGKYYMAMRNYQLAEEHLILSQKHAITNNLKPLQISNLKTLSEVYEKTGQLGKALSAYKQFEVIKDSVFSKESDTKLAEFQARFDNEKMQIENNVLRIDALFKKKVYLLSGILTASLVIILLAIIFILRLRSENSRQSKKIAEQKAERLMEEVEFKNNELTYNSMSIIKNNELITEIIEGFEQAMKNGYAVDGFDTILQNIRNLERDKSWKEFEVRFTQVHKDFYEKLNLKYPDLTPNEIKLCAFLRLNMTTKDISAITRQSVHSINVARTRLRKKLNLANCEENLINFLMNL
jgi:tetratricopeptide (TPR) repeat protein/DNA-binding CsgD family transcriptional regulator